jgi:hypothetical protein
MHSSFTASVKCIFEFDGSVYVDSLLQLPENTRVVKQMLDTNLYLVYGTILLGAIQSTELRKSTASLREYFYLTRG